jgi:peptidoglycan/xylan/chitin deacetylase (PgdA/CDA1 family)
MFIEEPLDGSDLPPKTLCMTYDDGPGIATPELAAFLQKQRICATFFVVGRHAEGRANRSPSSTYGSHLVGNHTYSHPGLADLLARGGDPVAEVLENERFLGELFPALVRPFRPPYGNWSTAFNGKRLGRELSDRLNSVNELAHCIGPVVWDISAADYEFWERGDSAEECCAAYLNAIERIDHGIILMHDSSEKPSARLSNRAFETTVLLVPRLRALGYHFVSLFDLPQVRRCVERTSRGTADPA